MDAPMKASTRTGERKICKIYGCGKKHQVHGFCAAHARRARLGLPMDAPVRVRRWEGSCSVDGCNERPYGHGMCMKHLRRFRKHGDVHDSGRKQTPKCSVDGCDDYAHAKGICSKHIARMKKHGSYEARDTINAGKVCSVDGCENEARARGLCGAHRNERVQAREAGRPCPDLCEICGAPETRRRSNSQEIARLCWDHDHATGKFRGWLCHNCNTSIGKAFDNPERLRKMALYVETAGACLDL